jgi:hypothetical protein
MHAACVDVAVIGRSHPSGCERIIVDDDRWPLDARRMIGGR